MYGILFLLSSSILVGILCSFIIYKCFLLDYITVTRWRMIWSIVLLSALCFFISYIATELILKIR